MKRTRNILKSCDCCQIQFESTSSFTRHCSTQAHRQKLLAAQNASVIEDEDWENDCAPGPVPACTPTKPPDTSRLDRSTTRRLFQ